MCRTANTTLVNEIKVYSRAF